MELRVLNYYLMIAREENITKAAQILHVTQPTLSRQMMQLEEELGVKLFERSNHKIVLTDDGMLLKDRAQEILTLVDKTKKDIGQEETLNGKLVIGSGEFKSCSLLASMLASFREQYPDVHYELYSGNADNIKEKIEKGLLDMGLLTNPVDIGKYEFLRIPEKEIWGMLVRRDSKLGGKEYLTPEDLKGQNLIISVRELVQNQFAGWCGTQVSELNIAATYNLLYNAAAMVQQNLGIALCIDLDCHYDNLCFIPLSPRMETESVLVWKKNQTFTPTLNAFIKYARKCDLGMVKD